MIFARILAGGKGERINAELPKQFISVCGKPIICYCLEQFCATKPVDKIIVSCNKLYVDLVEKVIETLSYNDNIVIIEGGHTRHQSLVNIINYIKRIDHHPDDKILIHEAARPLVDQELIIEHIVNLEKYEATNTLFRAVDTMMISNDGEFIYKVPAKKTIYHGQTPQGYRIGSLIRVLENDITENDIINEVDLCAVYMRDNRQVKIVRGNERLFKVTLPRDLILLEYYIKSLL